MYEYRTGSIRLVNALQSADKRTVNIIADLLNYVPEQLEQDIKANYDYVLDHARAEREAENEE